MQVKFDVYFKQNLGTILKTNEVRLNGVEAFVNIDLAQVDKIEANYLVNYKRLTDDVKIVDVEKNIIQIPFKSEVTPKGLSEFELLAYMKDGNVKPSQTCTYDIAEGIGAGENLSLIHFHRNKDILDTITQEKIDKWDSGTGGSGQDGATFTPSVDVEGNISWTNNKGLTNPTTQNIKGPRGDTGLQGVKGDKGEAGVSGTNGTNGRDGLTTAITVNGTTYNHVNGTITLPNYPTGGGSGVTVENVLTSTSTVNALSANQGKELDAKITVLSDNLLKINSYKDITSILYRDKTSNTSYYLTYIPHKNEEGKINRLKLDYSGDLFNDKKMSKATDFAKNKNSKICLNAGIFNVSNSTSMGTFIKDGIVLQEYVDMNNTSTNNITWNCHILGIKEDNTIVDYPENTPSSTLLMDGVKNALVGFVPLIKNGTSVSDEILKKCVHGGDKNPRQVIGQLADKSILILSCDGRTENEDGMILKDCIRILLSVGCVFAYNLDGGGSTSTVLKNKKINRDIDVAGERLCPNFLYIEEEKEQLKYTKYVDDLPMSINSKYGYTCDMKIYSKVIQNATNLSDIKFTGDAENGIINISNLNIQLPSNKKFLALEGISSSIEEKNGVIGLLENITTIDYNSINSNRFSLYPLLDSISHYGVYCVDVIPNLLLGGNLDNKYQFEVWDRCITDKFNFYKLLNDLKGKTGVYISFSTKQIYLSIPKSEVDILEGVNLTVKIRTWVANNPFKLYYPVTPESAIFTPIASIKDINLKTNDISTTITSTNTIRPKIEFKVGFDELTSLRIMCERNDKIIANI